jgi:hypothetical protein
MRIILSIAVAAILGGAAWPSGATAQNASVTTKAPPGTAPAAGVTVAEQADRLLKQMSGYIGSADQFTFHADISFDHVLPTGQKLLYTATEDVALQRPGGLYVEWHGDLGDRQFWYDGKSVTLYDPSTSFYATDAAAPDIDAMLDKLVPQLDFAPPLVDFLYRDPYQSVRGKLQYGLYLGLNDVDGRNCHTLAFVEQDIDWQIWIEAGPQLTPCKLVITYKTQPAQPQFTAVFSDWDFAPRIAKPVFTPDFPPGTQKIPFAPVVASTGTK